MKNVAAKPRVRALSALRTVIGYMKMGANMKRTFLTAAMLVGTSLQISCGTAGAAASDQQVKQGPGSAILATDDRPLDALRRGDSAPLQLIYADDYSLVTPSGVVRSKAEQLDDLKSGRVQFRKIETIERTVRVYGNVAIILAREKSDILQAGQQVGGDILFTRTYLKVAAGWRVIATHGSFAKRS